MKHGKGAGSAVVMQGGLGESTWLRSCQGLSSEKLTK